MASILKRSFVLAAACLTFLAVNAQTNLLTQGFETLPFPPAGWSNVRLTGPTLPGTWARYGNGLYPVQTPHTGSWQIRYNAHNFLSGTSGDLRTSVLDFTTAGTYTVSFWMYRDNWVANDKLEVFVNTVQTSVGGTLLGTINRDRNQSPAVGANGWYQYTFTIPGAFNTSTNYIIFKATSGFGNDIYVDDISVDRLAAAAPGCIATFTPASGTTGACINQTITWGIVPLASGYKLTMGSNAPNYNNVANNLDLGVALNYSTFLSPSTTYFWKITPYNAFGDAPACTSNSFTTGSGTCYCTPVYLDGSCGSEDYIDDFSTTLGTTNISNNNSGCTTNPNNYTYFSGMTVTATQGNSFNVSMQAGPTYAEGFAIWADWNQDGDFADADEYVFNSGVATLAVINGSITVPYSAAVGTTRLRVRCAYNYVPTAETYCTTFSEGETEDYNITVNACAATTYYADADGDGFGNPGATIMSCTGAPVGYVGNHVDCNDTNAAIRPGAAEACNSIDDDCDGSIDEGLTFTTYYQDLDGDGFGTLAATTSTCTGSAPTGYSAFNTDCNDANAAIKPGATEICNGIDDDCDATIDDGLTFYTYYFDADGDGYGTGATTTSSCAVVPPSGYVVLGTDCNDANAAIKPSAVEICNTIDDDCDASIDEGLTIFTYYRDADADTYGNNAITTSTCAAAPTGYVANNLDCNDANAAIKPGATEICNSIDDDCDASIDEGVIVATITPSGPTTFCNGGTVTMSANTGAGYTYQWIRNGANVAGATSANYTVNKSGNYQVKITIPGGCFNTSATTVVTVLAAPKATITAPGGLDLCGVGSVMLKANLGTGYTYVWKKNGVVIAGETTNVYIATTVGNYRVTVTNASGCSKTSANTAVVATCRSEQPLIGDEEMQVFPNPASDIVNVHVAGLDTQAPVAKIVIADLTGQQVIALDADIVDGEIDIELKTNELPSGVYLISVVGAEAQLTQQLVISK